MFKRTGSLLKEFRKQAGIKGVDLAKRLNTSVQFVNNVEHGRSILPPNQVKPWSKAIGVDPDIVGQSLLVEHNDRFCKRAGLEPKFDVRIKRKP